jgi:putative N6-adenine-specific DNA methylase
VDPFCGSGTLLIEAALLAANIPSLIERQHFAFKNLLNYQPEIWNEIQEAANFRCKGFDFQILGSDIDSESMLRTKRNLRGLPIGRFVEVSTASFDEVKKPAENGVLICNPPYGERIGESEAVEEMYEALGDWFKNELKGFDCWVISSNQEALKRIGLKPDRKIKLYNGDLECSYRKFSIFDGFKKDQFSKIENQC